MKTFLGIILISIVLIFSEAEEFFATAQEALIIGEVALRQNDVDPNDLVLYRMEIKPNTKGGKLVEGEFKKIYEQANGRDFWILFYVEKEIYKPTTNYGFSYAVILFSKTEAAFLKH